MCGVTDTDYVQVAAVPEKISLLANDSWHPKHKQVSKQWNNAFNQLFKGIY